jgi:hypothetical protein
MKVTMDVFVIWNADEIYGKPHFEAWSCDVSSSNPKYALACRTNVEVDIPDDFDPVPGRVKAMRDKKQEILATAQMQANNIEEQIQKLLCIEFKPEAK